MLYFAYGSNLQEVRFNSRIRAEFKSLAVLRGYRLVFHKPGAGNSGKATIILDGGSSTEGALFAYSEQDHQILKKIEAGYSVVEITVHTSNGDVRALTFIADALDPSLLPFDWYVALIVDGGRRLGLSAAYLARLEALPTKIDPDAERSAREWAFIRGPASNPS